MRAYAIGMNLSSVLNRYNGRACIHSSEVSYWFSLQDKKRKIKKDKVTLQNYTYFSIYLSSFIKLLPHVRSNIPDFSSKKKKKKKNTYWIRVEIRLSNLLGLEQWKQHFVHSMQHSFLRKGLVIVTSMLLSWRIRFTILSTNELQSYRSSTNRSNVDRTSISSN